MATKQQFSYPSSASVTVSAIGPNGAPIPTTSILIAGENPSLNLQPLQTDAAGNLKVALSTSPQSAVTADQGAPNTIANAWPVKLTDGTNTNSFTGSSLNVAVSASALPAGAATAANQATEIASLSSIDGKTPALGQALDTGSVPVVLTAAQLSTLTPLTSVTVTQATGTNLHAVIDNFPATQPISGTVTVTQGTTPWADNISQINGVTPLMGNGVTGTGSQRVTIASDNTAFSVNATLQAGSAIAGKVGIDQTTPGTTNAVSLAQIGATTVSTGNGVTGAGSQRVTIASDNSAIPVSPTAATGRSKANAPTYYDYTGGSVTTAAYTQIIASTTSTANSIEIFDSSGQGMILAVGAPASEVDQLFIFPGGNGPVQLAIPSGSRVSIKAKTATASTGYLMLNLYT